MTPENDLISSNEAISLDIAANSLSDNVTMEIVTTTAAENAISTNATSNSLTATEASNLTTTEHASKGKKCRNWECKKKRMLEARKILKELNPPLENGVAKPQRRISINRLTVTFSKVNIGSTQQQTKK